MDSGRVSGSAEKKGGSAEVVDRKKGPKKNPEAEARRIRRICEGTFWDMWKARPLLAGKQQANPFSKENGKVLWVMHQVSYELVRFHSE